MLPARVEGRTDPMTHLNAIGDLSQNSACRKGDDSYFKQAQRRDYNLSSTTVLTDNLNDLFVPLGRRSTELQELSSCWDGRPFGHNTPASQTGQTGKDRTDNGPIVYRANRFTGRPKIKTKVSCSGKVMKNMHALTYLIAYRSSTGSCLHRYKPHFTFTVFVVSVVSC